MHSLSSIPKGKKPEKRQGAGLKKNCIFIPVFILFSASFLHAQSTDDSLKAALKNAWGEKRAELLIELSEQTRQKDVEKAIAQAKEALAIAKRQGNERLQSESFVKLGWYFSMSDRDTTALEYYLKALIMERQYGHRVAEANVLHRLGRFYRQQDNHPKALNYFFQALRIREAEGKSSDAAVTLNFIGYIYEEREQYEQALSFFKKSYTLQKEAENYRGIAFSASGIAHTLQLQGRYEEAITYYEKALQAAEELHSTHARASILLNMSSVYQKQSLFEKAIRLNNKQLKIAIKNESNVLKVQGFNNLAGLYKAKGNIERSNQYLKQAILLNGAMGFSNELELNKLAQNYLQQQNFFKSVNTALKGLQQAKNSGTIQQEKLFLETLVQAYNGQGEYRKALQAQTRLIAANEQIYNREKAKQIVEMQTRYETEKKSRR